MKKSGIILEFKKNKAIIMTNEVGFTVIKRKPGMSIGGLVDLSSPGIKGFDFMKYRYIPALTSVAAFIIILFISILYKPSNIYAYVTVDINPSIEFTVNKEIQVIDVRNLNNDGITLLRGTDFKNMPIAKALLILVNKAEQNNFFNKEKGKFVLVAAATGNTATNKPGLLEKSIQQLKEALSQREIRLQYIQATLAQRKSAIQNHLSMGRYALLTSANNAGGKSIDLNEAKTGSIFSLLDKAGALKKEEHNKTNMQFNKESKDLHSNEKVNADPNSLKIKNIKQDALTVQNNINNGLNNNSAANLNAQNIDTNSTENSNINNLKNDDNRDEQVPGNEDLEDIDKENNPGLGNANSESIDGITSNLDGTGVTTGKQDNKSGKK